MVDTRGNIFYWKFNLKDEHWKRKKFEFKIVLGEEKKIIERMTWKKEGVYMLLKKIRYEVFITEK